MVREIGKATLPAEQYLAYGLDGDIIATRATRAHTIFNGLEVILRDGDSFADGVSVAIQLTDEQLEGLGFISKEKIAAAILAHFPDSLESGIDPKELGKRARTKLAMSALADEVDVENPYDRRDRLQKEERARLDEQMSVAPIEPELSFGAGPQVFDLATRKAGFVGDHRGHAEICPLADQIVAQMQEAAQELDACGGKSCCSTCDGQGCCAGLAKK